ncbi:N-acetylmuramoyl-L-alanine amidase [Streptomyces longwoodensis]|uniref:peptidoglycan recognition protein family protein n=1 Tax=Streptomyces longwoodensis TaxID=68231 RepID=UPI00380BDB60
MATPLSADRLVAALKAEGCTVHEVAGWRTNNRNRKGAWGPVQGVIVHHTVTGPGTDVVGMIFHGRSDLPGPLATGCITKNGTVHLVGNGRANHAGGGDPAVLRAVADESYGARPPAPHEHEGSAGAVDGNSRFYGWECENRGDGRDPWPPVQYTAMVKATAAICRAHGWSEKSGIGHLEWSDQKPDPRGFSMTTFRADLKACLAQPAGRWPHVEEDEVPNSLYEANAVDVDLPSGEWTALAFRRDGVLHTGPVVHDTLVHLYVDDATDPRTRIEGRFYVTDLNNRNASAYLAVDRRGGGGHQFAHSVPVPAGKRLWFEVRPTTPDGRPVRLLHRVVSGPYWTA